MAVEMMDTKALLESLLPNAVIEETDQLTVITDKEHVLEIATLLRDHSDTQMALLLDLCVVDYLHYGIGEWETDDASHLGFARAQAEPMHVDSSWEGPRFVVVCHLLSLVHTLRIRLKIHVDESLNTPTLSNVWPSSIWYEREAYDLFGVTFDQHPDLRRILTDYGFKGFPFRKDFPLIGTVEMRYDGEKEQCIYEPVTIENRVGVPKVIREDHRYVKGCDKT